MPKMFIHAPRGTFDADARAQVAGALTDLGLRCEALPQTPFVRSTVWIYFNDYADDAVFTGGQPATSRVMSLLVYAIEGGLDPRGKQELIAGATETLGRHSGAEGRIPAFVVIREVPEGDWGVFGEMADLEALRRSPDDALPFSGG